MSFELFKKIEVIPKAHELVLEIYRASETFPGHEIYGVCSQLRRSAVSVPTNICEGKGRGSDPDFLRFLLISRASLMEVRYLLLLSKDLRYLSDEQYRALENRADSVAQMLSKFISKIKASIRVNRNPGQQAKKRKAESGRLREDGHDS